MGINEGAIDRWTRMVVGVVALVVGLLRPGAPGIAADVVGVVALITGLRGVSLVYAMFGMTTVKPVHAASLASPGNTSSK